MSKKQTRTPRKRKEDEPEELILRPWQIDWSIRAREILENNVGYADLSSLGSGKTIIALYLALYFRFSLLVICPVSVKNVWETQSKKYGVDLIDVISYQSLRSINGVQPKHGLLNRYDLVTPKKIMKAKFEPTQKYLKMVENGILVILDESQYAKNNSEQYKSCRSLLKPIVDPNEDVKTIVSRFGILSRTPIDKEEQILNFLRMTGFIRSSQLYSYNSKTNKVSSLGFDELKESCLFYNPVLTNQILNSPEFSNVLGDKKKLNYLVFILYNKVIKKAISGSMSAAPKDSLIHSVMNGFFNIRGENEKELIKAIAVLKKAVKYRNPDEDVEISKDSFGNITTSLKKIEESKAADIARVCREILEANDDNKVIVALNFTSSLETINKLLSDYNPLILQGSTKEKNRGPLIDSFNEDKNYRVLIMNLKTGGMGISLHDTVGDSPRFMIISPSYDTLAILQASGRTVRDKVQSDTFTKIFYGSNDSAIETNILNALARKSAVTKAIVEDDNSEIPFPVDYKSWYEPSDHKVDYNDYDQII